MSNRFVLPSFRSQVPKRPEVEGHELAPATEKPIETIAAPAPVETGERPSLLEEKVRLHGKFIDEFNLTFIDKMTREELHRSISGYVSDFIHTEQIALNQKELESFTEEIIDEIFVSRFGGRVERLVALEEPFHRGQPARAKASQAGQALQRLGEVEQSAVTDPQAIQIGRRQGKPVKSVQ